MEVTNLPFVTKFLRSQVLVTPDYPTASCAGQTFIVTGANGGLGLEAARHLVRLGAAKVVLAVRSAERGDAARRSIDASTGRAGVAEVWPLDLASYTSVRAFAARADADLDRLDGVVANAGIATETFRIAEADESTLTVNVVSTFLLALLLLPKLRASAAQYSVVPCISIVSSELHAVTSFREKRAPSIFVALDDESQANMSERYHTSKLLQVLAMRELAALLSSSGKAMVVVNCLNPGLCRSEIQRDIHSWKKHLARATTLLLARTAEVGGRTLVAGVTAGEASQGRYMDDGKLSKPSSYVKSEKGKADGQRVWAELLAKLEEISPGIGANI